MSVTEVGVNLTWMAPGRVGGSEQYLTRQLSGITSADFRLTLFADAAFVAAHPELARQHDVETVPVAGGGRTIRIIAEHSWLAWRARGCDVVHHGGGTVPMLAAGPIVLTVHDLQYLDHPEYFTAARRRYLAAMMPRSARRAAVVAVPTEAVRSDVIAAFGIAGDHVVVVPHGVPATAVPDQGAVESVRDRWGLGPRPYVVYPAMTHPHKRHRVLIDMLERLPPGDETALVLTGGRGLADDDVVAAIASSPAASRIVRVGRVADADRDALLAGADALVFPSEFEGFGAPLVEAMVLETPVVCSDARAVTEVVGDAAVIVHDASGEGWVAGIDEARRRRVELVERGRRRRGEFTVERAGQALAAAYRRAAAS